MEFLSNIVCMHIEIIAGILQSDKSFDAKESCDRSMLNFQSAILLSLQATLKAEDDDTSTTMSVAQLPYLAKCSDWNFWIAKNTPVEDIFPLA